MNVRDLSLKRKVMLIVMLTSSVALLLASAGFLAYDLSVFRARMSQDLMAQAEIIGVNSTASLLAQNRKATTAILDALRAKDEIVAAAFYGPDGKLLTYYQRDPNNPVEIPPRAEASGYHSDGNEQRVFYRIAPDKETIGTVAAITATATSSASSIASRPTRRRSALSISSRTCITRASASSAIRGSSPS
jgi:hypothetical protein